MTDVSGTFFTKREHHREVRLERLPRVLACLYLLHNCPALYSHLLVPKVRSSSIKRECTVLDTHEAAETIQKARLLHEALGGSDDFSISRVSVLSLFSII